MLMKAQLGLLLFPVAHSLRVFAPSDFAIKRQIGQLGFATETEWQYYGGKRNPLDPNMPTRTVEASGASVRLFDAELYGRRVLLKEYLGEAGDIGSNELSVYQHMHSQAASADEDLPPQISSMLGHMRADEAFDSQAFRTQWLLTLPQSTPPEPGNLWTVFAWEGLQTVAAFPRVKQQKTFFDWNGDAAVAERKRYLKAVAKESLKGVAFLHGRGIVHRSLGGSSLLLNTYDHFSANSVSVKLTDFGFASVGSQMDQEEVAKALRMGAASPLQVMSFYALNDLHGLGYVFLELFLSSLAFSSDGMLSIKPAGPGESGRGQSCELQALKRLVEDVFDDDVSTGFREYCVAEPDWAEAVAVLDEKDRAGWALLQKLVDCHKPEAISRVTASDLLNSRWFS
mmetsp:Transcript_4582/g.9970  ORF Transcript_4582/g.9970 Transcript_4582/m.9970 type:complete len:398 (+) Transcript_4582:349-1542(+)